jgi:hypothetical protein
MIEKKYFDVNFFEERELILEIMSQLKLVDVESKYSSFGLIGVSANKFFKVYDKSRFTRNSNLINELEETIECFIDLKKDSNNEIDKFVYFSRLKLEDLKSLVKLTPNFEFVMLILFNDSINVNELKKRNNKFNLFISHLSRKRWINGNDFMEINLNILHSRCSIIHCT